MRILFFNYEYPPLGGGAANATAYLLKEYAKISNLEVDLVTSSIDNKYHLEKIGENICIHRLPIGKNKNNLHYQSQKDLLVYLVKACFFACKLARKNTPPHQCLGDNNVDKEKNSDSNSKQHRGGKYDLSHSFFTVPCGFISLILKWKFKIPYIVSLRGSDVPGYSERFSFLYTFITPLTKLIWKKSSAVFANSQGLRELALKTDPKQEIGVIYNGIDVGQFINSQFHKAESPEIFKILCVTRVTPRKGIRYLIEALKKLSENNDNISLKIIGDGDEKEDLEKLAENLGVRKKVDFTGLIPHEKLPPYFSSADVFVLPSLNEGMSNSMLEALASGLPLIATDTGGTRELIDDGKNGFIIKMKDSEDIAVRLGILMRDRELRKRMGETSHEKAQNMSWEKVAREYLKIYEKLK